MGELKFYRDEEGAPRAKGEDTRVACFLESDIQDAVEIAQDLLMLLKQPEEAEFHGNSHSLSIDPQTVCLSNHADESAADRRLSRDDFAKILIAWCSFLECDENNN